MLRSLLFLSLLLAASATQAQTVQLPTFQQFAISTSVLVPDRGGASMGGVGYSANGRVQFGSGLGPGNRAAGGAMGAGGMSVSVQIHDMRELDEAVLAQAAARKARLGNSSTAASAAVATAAQPASLDDIARRQQDRATATEREAGQYFAKARTAESEGKAGVARIYYQMAARRASGDLQRQATARLDALAHQ